MLAAVLIGSAAEISAQAVNPRTLSIACNGCHRDKFEALAANPHAALESAAWLEQAGVGLVCLACHGDVDEHVRAGGGRGTAFAFREEPVQAQVERCLDCHNSTHPEFAQSVHARAGLSCMSCHSVHDATAGAPVMLKIPPNPLQNSGVGARSQLCFDCHGEIFAQFSSNERHRLHEGALECVSCHNPHAPQPRQLLGGFKQSQCVSCHLDKEGPFVFEHPASRVESCTACHTPHGSPNRHLLAHQRVAELCISCHAEVPQFHLGFSPVGPSRFNLDTKCTNCHSSIHGSNFDPRFLR